MKQQEYVLCVKKKNDFQQFQPFCTLNVVVALLSMEGQKAIRFHKKLLNLYSEDEQMSYGFGMT